MKSSNSRLKTFGCLACNGGYTNHNDVGGKNSQGQWDIAPGGQLNFTNADGSSAGSLTVNADTFSALVQAGTIQTPGGGQMYPANFVGPLGANDARSPIPLSPAGADLFANMREAQRNHMNAPWFKAQVANNGAWDVSVH